MIKKQIKLTKKERAELERYTTTGVRSVRLVNRAKVILARDMSAGKIPESQESIAERIGVSRQTVNNAQNDFLAAGSIGAFLQRKKRETPPVPAKVTGELEARIIALACGEPPKGYARWTLQLLADTCVQLHYIESVSHMTISRLLKKRNLNLI